MKEQVGNVHRFGKYFLLENSIGGLTFLRDEQFRILSLYAKSKSVSCTCEKIIAIYNISVEKQEIVRENVKRFIENCDRKGLVYKDFYLTGEFNKYYPRVVNIELTNCCNFFCSHCYKKAETTNTTFLDKTFIIKFCQQYSKKIATINLTGGEPLTHPNISEIILLLSKHFTVNLTTNASLLRKLPENVIACLNDVQISLYGIDNDSFSMITNEDKKYFDVVINNIKYLKRRKKTVKISVTLNKFLCLHKENFVELMSIIDVDALIISKCSITGRATTSKEFWDVTKSAAEDFIDYVLNSRVGAIMHPALDNGILLDNNFFNQMLCGAGSLMYGISENGLIYYCISLEEKQFLLGNIDVIEKRACEKILDFSEKVEASYEKNINCLMCPIMEEHYEKIHKE